MTQPLKPCPFCGGEAEFVQVGTPRRSCIVECTNCGARHSSPDEGDSSGRSWNRRDAAPQPAPSEPTDEMVAAAWSTLRLTSTITPAEVRAALRAAAKIGEKQ